MQLSAGGFQHRHQYLLRLGARGRAIAAPDLAVHYRRTNGLLGLPVRRLDQGIGHEGKDLPRMRAQVSPKGRLFAPAPRTVQQFPQALVELIPPRLQPLARDVPGPATVPLVDGLAQERQHLTRKAHAPARRLLLQRLRATQQVSQTLLMDRLGKMAVVRTPSVMAQHALPVRTDDPLQDGGAALRVDAVGGGPVTDPDVKPGGLPSHPPAGLVGGDLLGAPLLLQDRRVIPFQPLGGALVDLGAGATRQVDAEERLEDRRDLAVRQTHLRVQCRRRRLGVWTNLAGRRSQGIGGLQRMPALHALAAVDAMADMHAKLADDRPARNLGLILGGDFRFHKPTVAMRTSDGQFGFVALGDLLGRWRRAMAVSAMFFARFAARRLGIGLRRPLAERRRLAFASAQGVLEQAGQFGDLGFKFRHAFDHRLAPRTTRNRFHAVIVRKPPPLSCASFSTPTRNTQSTTLNNDEIRMLADEPIGPAAGHLTDQLPNEWSRLRGESGASENNPDSFRMTSTRAHLGTEFRVNCGKLQ